MTERGVTESVVEQAALAWLQSLGWRVTHDLEIAPGEAGANTRTTPRWCWRRASARRWGGSTLSFPRKRWRMPSGD